MADFDLKSDEEKAEELKAWWKANGIFVIAAIALAIAGMYAFKQWEQHKLDKSEGASKLFSQVGSADSNIASKAIKKLNDDYSDTAYASLGALALAKDSCEKNDTEQCISQLRVASKSSQDSLAIVAKIRLARVLISTGKLDEAQQIIAQKMPASFASIITELEGDIHFAKKEFKKAREAYDKAILSSGGQNTQLLKLKRDDLGDLINNSAS